MKEGAEVPTFTYSSKGGKVGPPKVRVFDKASGEIQGIPTKSWATLAKIDQGEGSERGSVSPSLILQREGIECTHHPCALKPDNPDSPSDESL